MLKKNWCSQFEWWWGTHLCWRHVHLPHLRSTLFGLSGTSGSHSRRRTTRGRQTASWNGGQERGPGIEITPEYVCYGINFLTLLWIVHNRKQYRYFEIRLRLKNCYVWSVLLYGAETWKIEQLLLKCNENILKTNKEILHMHGRV